jgi:uncharacterized membrane protein
MNTSGARDEADGARSDLHRTPVKKFPSGERAQLRGTGVRTIGMPCPGRSVTAYVGACLYVGAMFQSTRWRSAARMMRASRSANWLPTQLRGPCEKGI